MAFLREETNSLLGLAYLLKYQDAKQHLQLFAIVAAVKQEETQSDLGLISVTLRGGN